MEDIVTGLAGIVAPAIGIVVAAIKSIRFVREGERGALLRFGRFRKTVNPGFVIMIPFVHELIRVHVRQTTVNLDQQVITLKDKLSFTVSAVILFRINNVYKALFEISELHKAVNNIGMSVVREIISSKEYAEATNLGEVNKALVEELKTTTKEWGIEIIAFQITDFAPTSETSHVMLQEEAARVQAKGNQILLDDIKENEEKLKKLDLDPGVFAALLLRSAGGVPVVNTDKS